MTMSRVCIVLSCFGLAPACGDSPPGAVPPAPWLPDAGVAAGDGAQTGTDGGGSAPDSGPDVPGEGDGSPAPDGSPDAPGPLEGEPYGEWTYVEVPGALCRDGSPAGYYFRDGRSDNLHLFLNGGGACSDAFFCSLNPANVNEDLPHEQLINATANLLIGPDPFRQVPPDEGIFARDARNPVADWDAVFVPYCTGDVHAGTRRDVIVDGAESEGPNQFVGYTNLGLFLESFGPHVARSQKVLLSGSSAGGFGALMNFDRVQTYFDPYGAKVYVVSDSGIPMRDGANGVDYMATCLQRRWRELWGFDGWLPAACSSCFRADGGGLTEALGRYVFHEKFGGRFVGGFVSSVEDGVMRAFFGAGGDPHDPDDDCKVDSGANTIATATLGGVYDGPTYRAGLADALEVVGRDAVAYYALPGTPHMHLWRARFYEENGTGQTIADWVADVLAERPTHAGEL